MHIHRAILVLSAFALSATNSTSALLAYQSKSSGEKTAWKSQRLSPLFFGEGGNVADLDSDGHLDVIAGPQLYFGPDFKVNVPLYEAKPFNIAGYSEYFFVFHEDIDRDGDKDILIVGFPGAASHWYRNPGKSLARQGKWERFTVADSVDNESPTFTDITGDGKPELVYITGGRFGFSEIPADPTQKWNFEPVSAPGDYQRFTHGLGVGDVNDDGRKDVLAKNGWWEQPKTLAKEEWKFHPFEFAGPGGAQMYAIDLDDDGRTEVITSLAAHGYGLSVYKKKDPQSADDWTKIDIMTDKVETSPTQLAISQLHAIDIADIDGDGKLDILTGKRFWAHNGNDNGENEPPLLVWFKPVVNSAGLRFIPNIIDDNSGVGTQIVAVDINGDKRTDVLSVSKRGVHILTQVDASEIQLAAHPRNDPNAIAKEVIEIKDPLGGFRPAWSIDSPVNLDFETGDLTDWNAQGGAFFNQPVKGDAVVARRNDSTSNHQGEFWIGSYEVTGDVGLGTLTSRTFVLSKPWISFLLAGGSSAQSRIELVDATNDQILRTTSGTNSETLKRAVVDASGWINKPVYLRLIDKSRDGWGHINFDDFRLHDSEPKVAVKDKLPLADVLQHDSLAPQLAAQAMTLPPEFSVQVIASEPEVTQPVAMTIDERGRLWIVEAHTYPIRAEGDNGKDRILIFEDTDLDGSLDSRKVFADGLNLVSGIEVGYGGVWVGAAPYLLFIPDANHDDVPDGPAVKKLDGWGYQDTHETLNSFIWGPDGWLYGCHGVFTHSEVGVVRSEKSASSKPTVPEQRIKINAGIWRYHPTKEVFEVFAHGTSNPWGVDFDDRGQAFLTACVIPHLYHVIPNARYQRQAGQHFDPYTFADIQTIAKHRHWLGDNPHAGNNLSDSAGGGHAHSGAMIYLGGSWPDKYRDQIFMNNIHGARLNQDQLTRSGSGYVGDRAPDFLLANDRSSQILYFRYGADGQVYAIDWYDAQQCHLTDPNRHDQSNGRIYRISYRNTPPVRVDLAKKSDLELAQYQTHSNDWYCRTSRRLLAERSVRGTIAKDATADLQKQFQSPEARIRLRALWTLAAIGSLNEKTILSALEDQDEFVRAWGVRLSVPSTATNAESARLVSVNSPSTQTPTPSVVSKLVSLSQTDSSPVVRLYIASACQTLAAEPVSKILPNLLKHAEDANDHNLPLMIWYAVSRAIQLKPELTRELLKASKIDLVSRFIARQWTQSALDKSDSESAKLLSQLLTAVADQDDRLTTLLIDEVLLSLEKKRSTVAPSDWPLIRKKLLARDSDKVNSQTFLLAAKFQDSEAIALLKQTLLDNSVDASKRLSALSVLRQIKTDGLTELVLPLLSQPDVRVAAVAASADSLNADQATKIVAVASKWSEPNDRRAAWYALLRRAETARVLLDSIAAERISASELSADMVQQISRLDEPGLIETIKTVWGNVRPANEDKAKAIAEYRVLIEREGTEIDLQKGRAVFAKTCGQCHVLFGEGGKIGPELTGSNRRDLSYLLENIMDPSAVMAKEYQPTIIVTEDGQTITGLLKSKDAESIKIQTATEIVTVYASDIAQQKQSDLSMMPADLLTPLSAEETRNLIAYLRSR